MYLQGSSSKTMPMKMAMKRVNICLSLEAIARARRLAAQRDTSVSRLIRCLMREEENRLTRDRFTND